MQYATVESIAAVNLICPECREGMLTQSESFLWTPEDMIVAEYRYKCQCGTISKLPADAFYVAPRKSKPIGRMTTYQRLQQWCKDINADNEIDTGRDRERKVAAEVIASVKAILGKQISTYSVSTLRFEIHALATTLRLAHKTDYHMQLGDDLHRVADRKAVDMS